jgi:hypothetical protein
MKSKVFDRFGERHLIECNCLSAAHLLIFDFYEDDFGEIDVYFTDDWRAPFWQRVKNAFRYVFKRDPYYNSNTIGVGKDNVADLEGVIAKLQVVIQKVKDEAAVINPNRHP